MSVYKLCKCCKQLFKVENGGRDFLCPECEQLPLDIEGKDNNIRELKPQEKAAEEDWSYWVRIEDGERSETEQEAGKKREKIYEILDNAERSVFKHAHRAVIRQMEAINELDAESCLVYLVHAIEEIDQMLKVTLQHTITNIGEIYLKVEKEQKKQIYIPTRISGKGGRLYEINTDDLKTCPACGERSLVLCGEVTGRSNDKELLYCYKCRRSWEGIEDE